MAGPAADSPIVSGSYRVHIVHSAARTIAEAAEWWVANRIKAPEAFSEELARAFQLLASQPAIGAHARNVKLVGVRPVHLQRTGENRAEVSGQIVDEMVHRYVLFGLSP